MVRKVDLKIGKPTEKLLIITGGDDGGLYGAKYGIWGWGEKNGVSYLDV